MKKYLLTVSILCFINNIINAQAIGTKKEAVLKLVEYFCTEDDCFIKLKDINNGKIYDFFNFDEKTKPGVLKEIQDRYFKNGETGIKSFIGKNFTAVLEFRKIDEYKYDEGTDAPAQKTGKKINKWMINSLNKINK